MSYSETRVDVGDFFIAPGVEPGKVWIGRQDGEGGDFPIEQIEELVRQYYQENF